jgi:hypothetical protein
LTKKLKKNFKNRTYNIDLNNKTNNAKQTALATITKQTAQMKKQTTLTTTTKPTIQKQTTLTSSTKPTIQKQMKLITTTTTKIHKCTRH